METGKGARLFFFGIGGPFDRFPLQSPEAKAHTDPKKKLPPDGPERPEREEEKGAGRVYETVRKVKGIPHERIFSGRSPARRVYEEASVRELAESIRFQGLIEPLTVRRVGSRYEIVSGERRFRAAVLSGMEEIPCLVVTADDEKAELLAVTANLLRAPLDFYEEAEALGRLLGRGGMSEEEAARRLGKSLAAIRGKLALLSLGKRLVAELRRDGLGERHARALLALEDEEERLRVEKTAAREGLSASGTEALVASILREKKREADPLERKRILVIKDVRVFFNSVSRAVETMRSAGIDARMERGEDARDLTLTVRIPKLLREA